MIQFAKYYMIVNLKSVSIIPVFSFTDTDGGHGFFFNTISEEPLFNMRCVKIG